MSLILRRSVNCFRCGQDVDRSQALLTKAPDNEQKFECYHCYKKYRDFFVGSAQEKSAVSVDGKASFYCEVCKYKFKGARPLCPYCGKRDTVVRGDLSLKDIM